MTSSEMGSRVVSAWPEMVRIVFFHFNSNSSWVVSPTGR